MSYRPEKWNRTNPKPIGTSMGFSFTREDMHKHGEDCANAILEALKNEQTLSGIYNKVWYINRTGGTWVFIPDEKEGK